MKTTTYKTTRVTSTTRATRAATPKAPASKAPPATFEIIGGETPVLIDGLVPLPLAQMFAAMTAAYNAGALKI